MKYAIWSIQGVCVGFVRSLLGVNFAVARSELIYTFTASQRRMLSKLCTVQFPSLPARLDKILEEDAVLFFLQNASFSVKR